MAELELRCLGRLELQLAGVPLTGARTEKTRALLGYLAVSGRTCSRGELASMFWSDSPEESARANLRVALTNLRKLLPEYLLITRGTLAFDFSAPYSLDVENFQIAFAHNPGDDEIPRLRDAVKLYQGDFLEGLGLSGAALFDEWAAAQRERLRQLVLQALHILVDDCLERRDIITAIDYLARLLDLDPWREEAHRQLMLLFASVGQRSAALEQFERCRIALDEGLGAEPAPETLALLRQIEQGDIEVKKVQISRSYLPTPITPLLGREIIFRQVISAFDDSGVRLLTLTGPGGVGKTRLALELAWALRGSYPDGTYFVSLSSVSKSELVPSTILQALELPDGGARSPTQQLKDQLGDMRVLLVLDNFEHLLPATGLVAELLAYCPELKVLATSRESLHLRGEHEMVVPPLAVPDLTQDLEGDGLERLFVAPSVQLFEERARSVRSEFSLRSDNIREVIQICNALDGLPLAIELAAARIKLLSPKGILRRLGHRLDLLNSGLTDVPKRHQSLRATLEWSYELLSKEERRLFRRLSVTSGGCSLPLVMALSGSMAEDDMTILELLTSLVDKSLLWRVSTEDDEPRVAMLATIQEYASERLAAEPQEEFDSRKQHARYFASLLRQLFKSKFHEDYREARQQIELELSNIRAAWSWSTIWHPSLLVQEVVFTFFSVENRPYEGIELFREVLGLAGEQLSPEMLARMTGSLAWLYYRVGQIPLALEEARRSVAASELTGKGGFLAVALETLGGIHLSMGAYDDADSTYRIALTLSEESGMAATSIALLGDLGLVAGARGNYAEAFAYYQQSRTLQEQTPLVPTHIQANILVCMGLTYRQTGDLFRSRAFLEEAYTLAAEIESVRMSAAVELGFVTAVQGENQVATTYCNEALRLAVAANDPTYIAWARLGLSQISYNSGNLARTALHLFAALSKLNGSGLTPIILSCLLHIATFLIAVLKQAEIYMILQLVISHPSTQASDRTQAEHLLALVDKESKNNEVANNGLNTIVDNTLKTLLSYREEIGV